MPVSHTSQPLLQLPFICRQPTFRVLVGAMQLHTSFGWMGEESPDSEEQAAR